MLAEFAKNNGEGFKDKSFPPNNNALFWSHQHDSDPTNNMETTYGRVKSWMPVTEFDANASLWGSQGIKVSGIKQGSLGDCWWLAGASAVAEVQKRIQNVFVDEELRDDGIMRVRLHQKSKAYEVAIDTRLAFQDKYSNVSKPDKADYLRTINAGKSDLGAWWGPILEKATAKFYTDYANMDGGSTEESMYMLTGAPTMKYSNSAYEANALYDILKMHDENNHIITGGVSRSNNYQLYSGHAYSILGVAEWQGTKLVKIRNPWGSEKYMGPWSDDSSEMKAAMAAGFKYSPANDGIFYQKVSDFKTLFSSFAVAMTQDWESQTKDISFERQSGSPEIKFENQEVQNAVVGFTGWSDRMFMNPDCASEEKMESMYFQVYDSNGSRVSGGDVTYNRGSYSSISSQAGAGWVRFKNLAVGTYSIRLNRFSNVNYKKNGGNIDLTFQTLGTKQAMAIY